MLVKRISVIRLLVIPLFVIILPGQAEIFLNILALQQQRQAWDFCECSLLAGVPEVGVVDSFVLIPWVNRLPFRSPPMLAP